MQQVSRDLSKEQGASVPFPWMLGGAMAKAAQIAAESAALQQIAVQGTQIERLVQTLKKWQHEKPELFVKRVYNQAGLDTLLGINR